MTLMPGAFLVFLAGVAGCSTPTSCGPVSVVLSGRWGYSATQTTLPVATLTGTLEVDPQACAEFQGSLNVVQTTQGTMNPLNGPVSGQALDATSVQFDAFFLSFAARRHLGAISHDSIRGTWVELTSGGIPSAGSFVAVKELTP